MRPCGDVFHGGEHGVGLQERASQRTTRGAAAPGWSGCRDRQSRLSRFPRPHREIPSEAAAGWRQRGGAAVVPLRFPSRLATESARVWVCLAISGMHLGRDELCLPWWIPHSTPGAPPASSQPSLWPGQSWDHWDHSPPRFCAPCLGGGLRDTEWQLCRVGDKGGDGAG